MLAPVHQKRHDLCVTCPSWDPERGVCLDVETSPDSYGADAPKVALAPWVFRLECVEWEDHNV